MTTVESPLELRARSRGASVPRAALRWLAVIVVGLMAGYAVVSLLLTDTVTRGERRPVLGTPADLGLGYESLEFANDHDGVRVRGWLLPGSGQRAIIMLHGLDSNRWEGMSQPLAQIFVQHGFNVLLLDLRGMGESGAEHLGLGWLDRWDVQAAVHQLEQRGLRPGRIGAFGASYGTTAAVLGTALVPDIAAVATDSAIADQRDLLNREIDRRAPVPVSGLFAPGIRLVAGVLYDLDWDAMPPERAAPSISPRPMLFIHGTDDRRVPVEHSLRLMAASSNPANELWIVPGAGHTQAFELYPAEYADRVVQFFDRSLDRAP